MVTLRRAMAIATSVLALEGCAQLLGGLDEGSQRQSADLDSATDAGSLPECAWLTGYSHRIPIRIDGASEAISQFQIRFELPVADLIAAGDLRADLADIRLTTANAVTPIPYWIESAGPTTAVIWAKLDIAAPTTAAWLYFGDPSADTVSSKTDTFVDGVIDDPSFDRPDRWSVVRLGDPATASTTDQWMTALGDGGATMFLARQAALDNSEGAVCQMMSFPSGSRYALLFDLDVAIRDHGAPRIWSGTLDHYLWATDENGVLLRTSFLAPHFRSHQE